MAHTFYEDTTGQKGRFTRFAKEKLKPAELPGIYVAISIAVTASMIGDGYNLRHTAAEKSVEIDRRMRICEDLLCVMSGDAHWGIERAKDHLAEYLIDLLNDRDLELSENSMWAAEDGRQVDMSTNDVRKRIAIPQDLRA